MLSAIFSGVVLERAAEGFGFGGDSGHEFGPSGIVFEHPHEWLVADGGTGELFRLHGLNVVVGEPLNSEAGVLDLTVGATGALYGSRLDEVVELDRATGGIGRQVAGGFVSLTGLVSDHKRGVLVVADFTANAIYEVDPVTGEKKVVARDDLFAGPDGVVLDGEGHIIVAGYESKHVVSIDRGGTLTDLGYLPGGPDGVAVGGSDGPFDGWIIVNQRNGEVVACGPAGALTVLATGGTAGDLVAVDPTGHLYVTQHSEIVRIGPAAWFAPQPWRSLPALT